MTERHVSGDRLSAFLDDELGDADASLATRHLADCETCLGELASLRATRDALRRLPSLQAPVLTAGVQVRSRQLHRAARRVRIVALLGALPLVFAGGVYLLGGDPGDPGDIEPMTELFLVEHLGRTGGGPVPTALGGGHR